MSDETSNDMMEDEEMQTANLDAMKATATRMGISYHPSIGAEKLAEKIKAKREEDPEPPATPLSPAAEETRAQQVRRLRTEALALVRIRVTCMNPSKKDIEGEIFTVGNSILGTVRKYVPFNSDEPWHVPQIIYDMMRTRKCQVFVKERSKNGVAFKKGKLINEFAIEVLPPLTEKELQELSQRQVMAQGS